MWKIIPESWRVDGQGHEVDQRIDRFKDECLNEFDEEDVGVLLFVVKDSAVCLLHDVGDQGNDGEEQHEDHQTIPPAQESFNPHREEDSPHTDYELLPLVDATLDDEAQGNQHPNTIEDKGVLQ